MYITITDKIMSIFSMNKNICEYHMYRASWGLRMRVAESDWGLHAVAAHPIG
jgi:hypothetical protein